MMSLPTVHLTFVLLKLSGEDDMISHSFVYATPVESRCTLIRPKTRVDGLKMEVLKLYRCWECRGRSSWVDRLFSMTSTYIDLGDFHKEVESNCIQPNQTLSWQISMALSEEYSHSFIGRLESSMRTRHPSSDNILWLSYWQCE